MQNTGRKKRTTRAELRNQLNAHFNVDELQLLADDLGVDFAGLPGDGKEAKILHLIRHVVAQGKAPVLLARCRELRPQVTWGEDIAPWDKIKPYVQVFLVLLVVAIASLVAYVALVPAQMPAETFNIAIAEFGESGNDGQGKHSEEGSRLSADVYQRLDGILKTLPDAITVDQRPLVWFDGLAPWVSRARIGIVAGGTTDDRRENAAEKANDLNADLLIYGNYKLIQAGETERGELTPEFFISTDSRDADEFTGRHQLGAPITIPLKASSSAVSGASLRLRTRQEALSRIAIALWYDAIGSNDRALDVLEQAASALPEDEWPIEDGRDVLYYLMGREHLYLGGGKNDSQQALSMLAAATENLERVTQASETYPAAMLALASTRIQRANWLAKSSDSSIDWAGVAVTATRAISDVMHAQTIKNAGANSPFEQKAQAILGDAYRLLGVSQARLGQFEAARDNLDKAIRLIEAQLNGVGEQQSRFRAQLHLLLGVAYHERARVQKFGFGKLNAGEADYQAAAMHYQACVNEPAAHDDIYIGRLRDLQCSPYLGLLNEEQSR